MSLEPLVSVVIPVYNRPYVVNTIRSICNQTYKNLEIIVIDNCSTDNTVEEINKINDSRIRVFINPQNMGQTYSINRGLELSSGKYIARIDSDDIALPERIEKQVKFMENNPDFVLCGSWVRYISDNDELLFTVKTCSTYEGMKFMQTIACGMYHPASMYRKDVIDENNIRYDYNIHMAEDYDLWAKLMEHGKALNIPEVLLYYRRGNNNDSQKYRKTMGEESLQIRKRICDSIDYSDKDKKTMSELIALEKKEHKSLFMTIKIYLRYIRLLNEHIEKESCDYSVIKMHIKLKLYGSCIVDNTRLYAKVLNYIYSVLKNKKEKIK